MKQGNQKRINYIHVLMKCKIMNLIYTLNFIAKKDYYPSPSPQSLERQLVFIKRNLPLACI